MVKRDDELLRGSSFYMGSESAVVHALWPVYSKGVWIYVIQTSRLSWICYFSGQENHWFGKLFTSPGDIASWPYGALVAEGAIIMQWKASSLSAYGLNIQERQCKHPPFNSGSEKVRGSTTYGNETLRSSVSRRNGCYPLLTLMRSISLYVAHLTYASWNFGFVFPCLYER